MNSAFKKRLKLSAQDFTLGVQAALENKLDVKIYPVEALLDNELMTRLDQVGVDGFYYNDGKMRCLASRLNYTNKAREEPAFSFRFARGVAGPKEWDWNREFARKFEAFNAPEEFSLFPKMHVESYSYEKGSGQIGWSFAAEMKDILKYYYYFYEDKNRIKFYDPTSGEKRKVVLIPIELFSKEYPVVEVKS